MIKSSYILAVWTRNQIPLGKEEYDGRVGMAGEIRKDKKASVAQQHKNSKCSQKSPMIGGKAVPDESFREDRWRTLKEECCYKGSLFISGNMGQEQEESEPQLGGEETGQFKRRGKG